MTTNPKGLRERKKQVDLFKIQTRDKYSIASQFIILDKTDRDSKRTAKAMLFEFQHAGIEYCICGHDQSICHPEKDVCYNMKCDCLEYVPSKFNNQLDVTKELSS